MLEYDNLPNREDYLFTIVNYVKADGMGDLAFILSNSDLEYEEDYRTIHDLIYVVLKIPHSFFDRVNNEYVDYLKQVVSYLYPRSSYYPLSDVIIEPKMDKAYDTWRQDVQSAYRNGSVNNQAYFPSSKAPMLTHKSLKFRSNAEIKIMEQFEKYKEILVFPLPAAVCGNERKEPDFLVCYKGKWAILEVVSDYYHPSVEKEADRAAWFQNHNIQIRSVPDDKCKKQPHKVVMEFLNWLSKL